MLLLSSRLNCRSKKLKHLSVAFRFVLPHDQVRSSLFELTHNVTRFPVIQALQYDPLWFGVLFMVNINVAWLSPPYGFNLFYMRAITPNDISMMDIYSSVIPFLGLQILCLLLVMFPQAVVGARTGGGFRVAFMVDAGQKKVGLPGDLV